MNDNIIDLDLIDENDENIFDTIMASVENIHLSGATSSKMKTNLESVVLSLEKKMQDLSDKDKSLALKTYMSVKSVVSQYASVIVSDKTDEGMSIAYNALSCLNNSITATTSVHNIKIIKDISEKLSIKNNLFGDISSIENIKKATFVGLANANFSIKFNLKRYNFDVWEIDMNFETSEFETHKPLEFIFQFIELFNSLEGVRMDIEDIKKGSLKVKIKALFENAKSNEDVIEILDSAKKFAFGKLEKDFEEKEKLKAEKEKLDIEKKLLNHELKENSSLDSAYLKALTIKQAEEDLKRKQLENLKLKIDLLKESRNSFSELIAEGFLCQGDFEVLINELPFLAMRNGKLVMGETPELKKGSEE